MQAWAAAFGLSFAAVISCRLSAFSYRRWFGNSRGPFFGFYLRGVAPIAPSDGWERLGLEMGPLVIGHTDNAARR